MVRSTSFVLLSLAGTGLAARPQSDIITHFKEQVKSKAHLESASHLPPKAAQPIFNLDLSLFGDKHDEIYEAMLQHEYTLSHSNENKDNSYPYFVCGSQRTADEARAMIRKHSANGQTPVAFASRNADVACWRVALNAAAAIEVSKSEAFFHVTQVPSAAKFAPELISVDAGKIAVAPLALKNGVNVQIHSSIPHSERAIVMKDWETTEFGSKHGNKHMKHFFPSSGHHSIEQSAWKAVRTTAESGECVNALKVSFSKYTQPSDHLLRLSLKAKSADGSFDHCVVAALAYLANQREVEAIGIVPSVVLHAAVPKLSNIMKVKETEVGAPSISNTISTTALQSGTKDKPNPFWTLGINGTDQFVEVSDTGFDDASCFFRPYGSASSLTGDFNGDVQVARTSYDVATTDFSRRKIVQYLMRNTSEADYGYDYAAGHGTHVAGTVAGLLSNDGSSISVDDYYPDCAEYTEYCDALFSSTGTLPGTCDATCNFTSTESYSGIAPAAKLMVYDFGDSNGALDVPDDMKTYIFDPAYEQGARIFSNSWGAGAPYNYYDSQAINIDQYIYDKDDVLVLFAAGNENSIPNDDVYESGDASIGAPAICKNVLTVGAAETKYTPDTLASFSSRGPTPDGRLKPEVVGPGDPVYSASASGSAGLATCQAVSMSGTSMATPAVAGASALIRQLLTEGHHESFSSVGYAASDYNEMNPSGALMKAILIGSTSNITYGYDSSGNSVVLDDFYSGTSPTADSSAYRLGTDGVDFSQGFGHVRLSNVFSLDSSFETFLYDDNIESYSTWTQLYEVSSTDTEVDVTLVWNDPPGPIYCGYGYYGDDTCLVHDLDLKVYAEGKRYYSNFGAGDGKYSGDEDELNNVEKVTIPTSDLTAATTIMVVVESNGLSYASSQNFSVVITGNLAEGSPVLAPTPSPTTTTWAPTADAGYCYSSSSVVKVMSSVSRTPVEKTLSEIQVGDEILALSSKGKQVYTPVKGLPHGPSVQPFVEVHLTSPNSAHQESHRAMVTIHHTFPTCNGKVKEAHSLKLGDCLFTLDGERRVKDIRHFSPNHLKEKDAFTYTVDVAENIEAISIGGVFTHARNGGHSAHIKKARNSASTENNINNIAPSKSFTSLVGMKKTLKKSSM